MLQQDIIQILSSRAKYSITSAWIIAIYIKVIQNLNKYTTNDEIIDDLLLALNQSYKLKNFNLCELGCIISWNYYLHNKKFNTMMISKHDILYIKLLRNICKLLEICSSNLYHLRIHIYIELIQYDINENFISNANKYISKALQLDYTIPKECLDVNISKFIDENILYFKDNKLLEHLNDDMKTQTYDQDQDQDDQDNDLITIDLSKTTEHIKQEDDQVKVIKEEVAGKEAEEEED